MPDMLLIIGALIYGVLYLVAVFIAALAWNNHHALLLTVAAIGLAFLSYALQFVDRTGWPGRACVCLSWLLALFAGLALII